MRIDKKEIGDYIMLKRRNMKLSQSDLAKATGLSKTTIQKIEAGTGNIGINSYIKLLNKLS